MRIWLIDVADLLRDEALSARRADFVREIVEAATSRAGGATWRSAVRCVGDAPGTRCKGRISVSFDAAGVIGCSCEVCNQVGVISGFQGTAMDLSRHVPQGKTVTWDLDEESRKVLLSATSAVPALRAIVVRAAPHAEIRGLLLVHATSRELDAMYTLVEGLFRRTSGPRRRELLSELLASLCSCIDGF